MNPIKISKRSKLLVLAILWTLGMLFLTGTYYLAYQNNFFNNSFFWISILLCTISTFFVISDDGLHRNYKILFLFLFGFTLYLIHILWSPAHFHFQDELFHLQTTKLICRTGSLEGTALFFEVSRYYPGLQILTASLNFITNLPIFVSAKILIGIIHSFVLIFLYLFFEKISSSERIAALGTFLYTGASTQFVFFNSIWSYESLGICLIFIILFLLSISADETHEHTKRAFFISVISIIVVLALVTTHHLSSYMLLLFALILSTIQIIYTNSKKEQKYLTFTVLTALLIFGWIVYIATITITYFGPMMDKAIINILKFTVFERKIERVPVVHSLLPHYEVIIDTYFYIPLLFFLFAIGAYFLLKGKKIHNSFIYALIICGFAFFLVLPSVFTKSAVLTRAWAFLAIGVSFVGAITLEKMIYHNKKKRSNSAILIKMASFVIVILILIGGTSIGCKPSHGRVPGLLSSNLMFGPSTITSDLLRSSEWFDQNSFREDKAIIVSDMVSIWVFMTSAIQNTVLRPVETWRVFFPHEVNGDVVKYLKERHVTHIIVDKRISKLLCIYKFYFEGGSSPLKNPLRYGYTQPLPKECLDKFDHSAIFYKVYDNGNTGIYGVNRGNL